MSHKDIPIGVFLKDHFMPLSAIVSVIIAVTVMQSDMANLKEDVDENKKQIADQVVPLNEKVQAIRIDQATLTTQFKGEQRVQKQYRDNMEKTMARVEKVLEKLADRNE